MMTMLSQIEKSKRIYKNKTKMVTKTTALKVGMSKNKLKLRRKLPVRETMNARETTNVRETTLVSPSRPGET